MKRTTVHPVTSVAPRPGITRRRSTRLFATTFLASAFLGAGASAPALAQRISPLEEIVVTARKRAESLFEVPESVSAFSAGDIERTNINGLSDVGLLVPNLYLSTRLDGFPNVTVRGMGGFGNTQGVGFYLDDIQLFSDASSRFGDLERIEVLKGPQGILYGGSNIGGALKFVSKRPDPSAFSGHAKVRAGEDDYFDGEVQVNIPLGETFAMRVFGFAETDDSYTTNLGSTRFNGVANDVEEDARKMERYGTRITLGGELSENLSVFAAFRYNELDSANNVWAVEVDGDFEYPDFIDTSSDPRHKRETTAGSLELAYDLDAVVITSLTSYTKTDSLRSTDLDNSPEWILDLVRPEDLEAFTQEVRLGSSDDSDLQWQVGAYYLDFKRDLDSELIGYEGFCWLDPGVCDPTSTTDSVEIFRDPFEVSTIKRKTVAGFANADYRMGDFEIGAGLRVDRTKVSRLNRATGVGGSRSDTKVLLRASGAYFLSGESNMLYSTFSQSFEPGGFNLFNLAGESDLFEYDSEKAWQIELGYKGDQLMDGNMRFSAAVFYINYKDRQYELQSTADTGEFIEGIINVGDSRQWGIEADLVYQLTETLAFTGSVGYVDAEWKSGTLSPTTTADISGQTPPNIADFSAAASLDYSQDISDDTFVFGRIAFRYKGKASTKSQFFDVPGTTFPVFENPSFAVVDVNAGMTWKNVTFDLHVENLFDKKYYIDVQEFPNFAGGARPGAGEWIIIGSREQPRRIIGSLKLEF